MSANERRAEIMRIMVARRQENMQVLAAELGVTDRTIRNDILVLTAEYPLETTRGNGGGVRIADWYHPHKNIFSQDQISVLEQLMDKIGAESRKTKRTQWAMQGSLPCQVTFQSYHISISHHSSMTISQTSE